jgi:hypothetical protein
MLRPDFTTSFRAEKMFLSFIVREQYKLASIRLFNNKTIDKKDRKQR